MTLAPVDGLVSPQSSSDSSLHQWRHFLEAYSNGDFDPNVIPPRPPLDPSAPTCDSSSHVPPLQPSLPYASTSITDEVAAEVRLYCQTHDYLPPPRSPHEQLRERLLLEYDIMGPIQTANIQAAVDILSVMFPEALCGFTLFRNNVQTVFAMSGSKALIDKYALVANTVIGLHTSLCGHSVLLQDQVMFSPRLDKDWRFRSNPNTLAGAISYIGSNVSLQIEGLELGHTKDLEEGDSPGSLGIGAFNILFVDTPHEVFTEKERIVVANVTRMLVTQLRATWEGHSIKKEARARKVVTELIEEGLDGGHRIGQGPDKTAMKLPELARSALMKLIAVTDLDGAALLDLRGVRTVPGCKDLLLASASQYPISVISSTPPGSFSLHCPDDVLAYLNRVHVPNIYTSPEVSGLEAHIPLSIQAHLLLPFFSSSQPMFLLVGISRSKPILETTVNIARSIGTVVLSHAVQTRVLEADASKTAFLSSISHELRTPLYGVLSGVELAQTSLSEGDVDGAARVLDIAQSSGLALSHILNDVLDFSRTAETTKPTLRRVSLAEVVRCAARMCITQFKEDSTGPSIVLDCEDRIVELNEAKYHRVLINGLTNALKFCKSGTITLSITYTDSLMTRIIDTGTGFDMQTLPRLLEPFTKQDQHSPGAGLGLHITKKLVEDMSGTLTLRSEVGSGTVFEVVLPMSAESSKGRVREILQKARSPTPAQPQLLRGLSKVSLSDKLRVLIVDDNAICLKILHGSLRKGSIPVHCAQATNGAEAVEMFRTFHPQLVLTDISMPVMDGVEAARRMREVEKKETWGRCAIFALTGLGSSDPRLKSDAIQGDAALCGWLVKGQDQMKEVMRIVSEVEGMRLRKIQRCPERSCK